MLFDLRAIKCSSSIDDSQYIHQLTYNALRDLPFRLINDTEYASLRLIKAALVSVIAQRAVPKQKMLAALGKERYLEYVQSYDWDISHVESHWTATESMPSVLYDYMQYVKDGDKYTRLANLFRRSIKRDANGKTAFQRMETKAESCYEEAVMLLTNAIDTNPLRNPMPDVQQSHEIQRWLDRDVNCELGFEPDACITGVPRIRGSKSKFAQMSVAPAVGQRLRQYWRQREALVQVALELLYSQEHIVDANDHGLERSGEMLKERLAQHKLRS
ncbi:MULTISPECIES: hypothetical protein [unclassified Polynucleobacter]|uniref:hypothetical protein n=1 Tax=unclassified Polynucleobacter TaxID=2640945 RepID=UPI0008B54BC9|nr:MULTISPECIES: hypothetical protein [unclassified Polynucleobacter]OHC09047.1 MAG: hypothetical protein A2X74_06445 [Polynucleobacter sp. GWA2_45_21]HBK43471.1 hypothetical protein [Polynucleobacter sp.]